MLVLLNLGIKSTQPSWCTGKKQSHGSSKSSRLTPSCPKGQTTISLVHWSIKELWMLQGRTQSMFWLSFGPGPPVSPCQESCAPPSLQGAFDQRMRTWQRWQDAQAMLQKKREMEARLLWANKPDKLQQAKDEISEVGKGAWGLCSAPALPAPVGKEPPGLGKDLLG